MQARRRVLARWKDGSGRGPTDGNKGEFPSESETYGTCPDQSHNGHDDAKGSLDRNPFERRESQTSPV